jgi:glycosyltransferase involved in cell wall biosynthesis
MKCVLIGPTYPFRGGIAHYTTLLCHHLRQRHQVEFVSFRRQYPDWLFPGRTDREPSQLLLTVDCERLIDPFKPWSWAQAARRIQAFMPDLLLLQWWVPFWAPVWSSILWLTRRQIHPQVLFIAHNVLPHEARLVDRLLARQTLGQSDALIVHSQRDRDDLLRLLPGAEVRVTVHPTYEMFAQKAPSRAAARRALDLDDEVPVLLFFGFVRPYKGLDHLIEALPAVLAHLDAHLLVAGEFWDDPAAYRERIQALGLKDRVSIVDRYIPGEEVGAYFAAADLVTLPYVDATQSGVIQIAFGFGVPVVTTTVGGLAEAVEDGVTGFLVPPRDSQALATAILRFFQEDRATSFRANIQAQQDRFSWERLVALIEELAQS